MVFTREVSLDGIPWRWSFVWSPESRIIERVNWRMFPRKGVLAGVHLSLSPEGVPYQGPLAGHPAAWCNLERIT